MSFACAGFESFSGAAQWAAAADPALLLALGAAPDPLTGQVHPPVRPPSVKPVPIDDVTEPCGALYYCHR